MQILYLLEVWHCDSDGSGAAIADFGGARISDELALKKRRIQYINDMLVFTEFEFGYSFDNDDSDSDEE